MLLSFCFINFSLLSAGAGIQKLHSLKKEKFIFYNTKGCLCANNQSLISEKHVIFLYWLVLNLNLTTSSTQSFPEPFHVKLKMKINSYNVLLSLKPLPTVVDLLVSAIALVATCINIRCNICRIFLNTRFLWFFFLTLP